MNEREKLIKLLGNGFYEALSKFKGEDNDKKGCDFLADYLLEILADTLLENGVVVPPCKIGDTIYNIYFNDDKKAYAIEEFVAEEVSSERVIVDNGACEIGIEEFGEYAFLSREEAEKALAERSDKE